MNCHLCVRLPLTHTQVKMQTVPAPQGFSPVPPQSVTSCPHLPEVFRQRLGGGVLAVLSFLQHACSVCFCRPSCRLSSLRCTRALFSSSFYFIMRLYCTLYSFSCWLAPFELLSPVFWLLWIMLLGTYGNMFYRVCTFSGPPPPFSGFQTWEEFGSAYIWPVLKIRVPPIQRSLISVQVTLNWSGPQSGGTPCPSGSGLGPAGASPRPRSTSHGCLPLVSVGSSGSVCFFLLSSVYSQTGWVTQIVISVDF